MQKKKYITYLGIVYRQRVSCKWLTGTQTNE